MASALQQRWGEVDSAFEAGVLNLAQARVIADALDALPDDLDPALLDKAQAHLVEQATGFGPRDLARLGERVMEAVAPEVADEAEYQRLLAAERCADSATKLFFRPRGDGSTDVSARVPDQSPTGCAPTWTATPARATGASATSTPSRCRADAARPTALSWRTCPLAGYPVRAAPPPRSPSPSRWTDLLGELGRAGVAITSTGDRITADQARRLACSAAIMPFVMGGKSVIHDQGRARRLFSDSLRTALNLLHPGVHRRRLLHPRRLDRSPSQGPLVDGRQTRLQDGTLLCPFHHHRAHDPAWNVTYHHDGTTAFTRRQ